MMELQIYRNSRQYGLKMIAEARHSIGLGWEPVFNRGKVKYWREYLAWCRRDFYKKQKQRLA